jgi:hypothetical protein
VFAAITKCAHALSPRTVTAGLKVGAHESFDLIWRDAEQVLDILKACMIAQRHLNDFAFGGVIQVKFRGWCSQVSTRRADLLLYL